MKLSERQRGAVVAAILGDIGTSRSEGWGTPSPEVTLRANKVADWLETLKDRQPETEEFFEASVSVAEMLMNDQLEVRDEGE